MDTCDADEWALALHGDGEAFGRVFDRHRNRVFRHSVRVLPAHTDADDVVAVVFFEAWRKRDSVRFVDGSLLPWLLVTATNIARNVRRGARRYRELLDRLPPATPPDLGPDIGDSEAETALRRLPLPDQQVLSLCVLEGFSEVEAAKALGIPRGTVKSRLSRAKQHLAAQMGDRPLRAVSSSERTSP